MFSISSREYLLCTTAQFTFVPFISTENRLIPSRPRASVTSSFSKGLPVCSSYAVRSAASITPPLAPNMSPAPEQMPIGESKSISAKSAQLRIPFCLQKSPNSLVVRTASTVGTFSFNHICLRSISSFLAVQGIRDTR